MDLGPDDPLAATYVDLNTMTITLNCGEVVAIATLLDDDGDECLDPDEAVAVIAGSDESGWWSVDLTGMIECDSKGLN